MKGTTSSTLPYVVRLLLAGCASPAPELGLSAMAEPNTPATHSAGAIPSSSPVIESAGPTSPTPTPTQYLIDRVGDEYFLAYDEAVHGVAVTAYRVVLDVEGSVIVAKEVIKPMESHGSPP